MTEKKKDVLRPVDDTARRLGKTLLRGARYASLATLDPTDGSPWASRVNIATTMGGDIVFLISSLSGHFTNLEADQRCSFLVGEPGKGDALAHPRMTLIGRAEKLANGPERDLQAGRYAMRHPKSALYSGLSDFALWRFKTARVSLNGGFGKAYAPTAADICTDLTGLEALVTAEAGAVAHMNADHADAVGRYAARVGETPDGWRLACIDPEGMDLARGDDMARVWFDRPLASAAELRPVLVALAKA